MTGRLAGVRPRQPIVRITEPQIYVRHEAGGLLVGGYGYRPMSFDMNEFDGGFEVSSLEADPVYYQQLAAARARERAIGEESRPDPGPNRVAEVGKRNIRGDRLNERSHCPRPSRV